jgi:hypothetical protein
MMEASRGGRSECLTRWRGSREGAGGGGDGCLAWQWWSQDFYIRYSMSKKSSTTIYRVYVGLQYVEG